jgi:biotin/methionine sulfoxide reductase
MRKRIPHCAHWGAFWVVTEDGRIVDIEPFAEDQAPSPMIQAVRDWMDPRVRIDRPMVREGWLEGRGRSDGAGRGRERFVPVAWDDAARIVADEIDRVAVGHGSDSIFAGSYGWTSAGRFHHVQTLVRRLLNLKGGYTGHRDTYSYAAGAVIARHVLGSDDDYIGAGATLDTVTDHGEVLLIFGALSPRTGQVESGGLAKHVIEERLAAIKARGVRIVHISPRRDDVPHWLGAEWWPIIPGTDSALLLALAGEVVASGLHDGEFLARCCSGSERFLAHLAGGRGAPRKDAQWAAGITGLGADAIRELAATVARRRTFISMSWSLQRALHGEQPWWAAVALAAVTGQIGLPGGGVGFGFGSTGGTGMNATLVRPPAMSQGSKPNSSFIPVARIADMLLAPGEPFSYEGRTYAYPDIRLIYWAGGNPFHHHQDLNRLERAWQRPETIIVQEPLWTATARRADIVLPATTSLERNDLCGNRRSDRIFAMQKAVEPLGEARSDFDILRTIADRLGVEAAFSEGRDEMAWIRALYGLSATDAVERMRTAMPSFEDFWQAGSAAVPVRSGYVHLARFRADPGRHPLATESGRIVLHSELLARLGYADCPPVPSWIEPAEWVGGSGSRRHPFHLITAQPAARLHSQIDYGAVSRADKVGGREAVTLHPGDAARLGLRAGDTAILSNDRGRCLAGVRLSGDIRPGVAVLPTGAWLDQVQTSDGLVDNAGNPNVLTLDRPSSAFSGGCSAHSCLVAIARYDGNLPPPGLPPAPASAVGPAAGGV